MGRLLSWLVGGRRGGTGGAAVVVSAAQGRSSSVAGGGSGFLPVQLRAAVERSARVALPF